MNDLRAAVYWWFLCFELTYFYCRFCRFNAIRFQCMSMSRTHWHYFYGKNHKNICRKLKTNVECVRLLPVETVEPVKSLDIYALRRIRNNQLNFCEKKKKKKKNWNPKSMCERSELLPNLNRKNSFERRLTNKVRLSRIIILLWFWPLEVLLAVYCAIHNSN